MNGQAGTGTGDVYTPTFMTVEPNGQISFDFEGHIQADGLDLLAGTSASPPDDRKIRWLQESDGSLVAQLLSYEGAGDTYHYGELQATNDLIAGRSAEARLTASVKRGAGGNNVAYLSAIADDGAIPFTSGLRAVVSAEGEPTREAIIIDDDGKSNFLQLLTANQRIVQIGQTNLGNFPIGNHTVIIPLPTVWTNAHFAFVATTISGARNNMSVRGSTVNNLASGEVNFHVAALDVVVANWISIGA